MEINMPESVRREYPFSSHYLTLNDGHHLHYLDEGPRETSPIIMVHGNPTWSFFYRNLIKALSQTRRVIAIDHLGCGLSEKPQNYDYTLKNHIQNLEFLFDEVVVPQWEEHHLDNQQKFKFDLIVHDWGGAIGMGLAIKKKEFLNRSVIMNTAAFTDEKIPTSINICKLPFIGEKLVRHFNAFAWPATFMAVEKPLEKTIKEGYLLPYDNYQNRIATARFVKDIPMSEDHPSWETLKNIEDNLKTIPGEKLLLWGAKDFCFTTHFFRRWQDFFPQAKSKLIESAGHYLLEDEPEVTTETIKNFLIFEETLQ